MRAYVVVLALMGLSPDCTSPLVSILRTGPGPHVARMPDPARKWIGTGLGRLVWKGMSQSQLKWLVGENQGPLAGFSTGQTIVFFYDYSDHGFRVTLSAVGGGELEVDQITPSLPPKP